MDRKLEDFLGRLDKDTYTKDDVAKLLHNEADFTESKVKKEYKDYVPKTELETLLTKTTEYEGKLKTYQEKEFNDRVSIAFRDVNGDKERRDDFIRLAGIDMGMDAEAIKTKAIELKETKKYDFLFKAGNSGGAQGQLHEKDKTGKAIINNFTPKISLWDKILNK